MLSTPAPSACCSASSVHGGGRGADGALQLRKAERGGVRVVRLYQTGVAHARAVALSTGGWARTDAVEVEPEVQGGALVTWPPPAVVRYMEEGGELRQLAV